MIADHIVFPTESESIYPYTVDRKHPGGGDALETFSILGVVAGATERLRLVTSALVLPYRNPVRTAKIGGILDVLSGGRVTLGVGVGWHPVGAIAASPLLPPREIQNHLSTLRRLTEAEGRDFSALTISYKAPLYCNDGLIPDRDGNRRSFSGSREDIAGDIRSFAAIGVHELILHFRGESIAQSIARLQRFAAEVMPLVGE